MSDPSIHDLLGLPAEITQPNPYQVFGLMLGEADGQVIRAAIEHRVASLKQAKSQVNPEVWSKAARAVQAAQKVLNDPEQKAALDATYGIINDPEPATITTAFDPLAALLPGSATQLPTSTPIPPDQSHLTEFPVPAISAQASQPQPAMSQAATPLPNAPLPLPSAPAPVVSPPSATFRRPVRRKRGSGLFIFGSLVLLLLACFALGAVYFFVKGGIQVVTGPDGIQIKTGTNNPESGGSPVVNTPSPVIAEPKGDGILKPPPPIRPDAPNAGDDVSMPPGMQPPSAQNNPATPDGMPDMVTPTTGTIPEMVTPEPPPMTPEPAPVPPTPEPTPPAPEPTPEPTPQMATPEELATGDAAIATARTAILSGKWDTMKSLAETAEKLAASEPQKQTAETLYQFADLATFYRSAVQKAMSDLVAGNVFKLGENMDFLVQRSSASEVVLYRNKREYPYTLDTLPISVAHALAPFALNAESPEGQAAMAVYQSISSKTTAGHRAQSVEILRGLESVKGADPQRLADLIESFGS